MIQIRSNLKGPIELSPKSGPVKFERSKNNNKPEFLNEISEEEYKSLLSDKSEVFKTLLKNGDLQVIRDEEDSKEESFTAGDVATLILRGVEDYKKGEGAELLQTSLAEQNENFEENFSTGKSTAVKDAKIAWETESKTKREEAVKSAVSEVKTGLVKKHNSEKKDGKITVWK